MKKRLFALTCALVLTFGMCTTVFAQPSATDDSTTGQYTESQLNDFATSTKVEEAPAGTTITPATPAVADAAVKATEAQVGKNAEILSVVELNVPAGTGEATFTLAFAVVKSGDTVYVLHQKTDGTWEKITPMSVENGKVTFKMTSYSPIAIVLEKAATSAGAPAAPAPAAPAAPTANAATAPKTADMGMMVALMSLACLGGAAKFGKKAN